MRDQGVRNDLTNGALLHILRRSPRIAMPTTARRGRQTRPATLWAAVAAALIVHGTVLGTVEALDLSVLGQGMSTRKIEDKALAAVTLNSNCTSDVLLASSARATLCFAP